MQSGHLTDDNRHEFIDPASLVIKIGVFPPRQKGLIARQSSEIKCLDSTRLTDLFDRIFCPTNSMSLLSGHDFAENPRIDPYPLVEHEFPNAFLFVDSNFYYDDRKLNSDLVAGQVRQWVATHDISVDKEKLECIPIQANDLRIRDLSPIFGYPYLYQVSHIM